MFSKINAQTPAELASGSVGTPGNGPTTVSQTARLLLNTTGTTYVPANTTVNITATISNQQYTGAGTGAGNPVLMFGATSATGSSTATSRPNYAAMSDIGSPSNTQYSNNIAGTASGIDVSTNLAFNMYTSVRHWAGLTTPATNSRIHMADLTLSFSTPLTNPILHIVGLGGTTGSLAFTSELDMLTPGLTLTRFQGSTGFVISGTQINNGSATLGASCSANNAACGSVRINGSNISSVTFRVYIRGNGAAADWGSTANHSGDQWLIGLSIPQTFSVSGNVFNDANGMSDNTVNGTGFNTVSGSQLYANLIETATGTVMGSFAVNSDGTYSFDGIPAGANVRVEISTVQGTPLAAAPSISLPTGWNFTGENIGAGPGSDGSPNGSISATVNGNISNVNVGMRTASTAASVSVGGRVLTAYGAGIRNAQVTIINDLGESQTVTTGSFGYYRFANIEVGRIYVITVNSKRFNIIEPTQVVSVEDAMSNINFHAYE